MKLKILLLTLLLPFALFAQETKQETRVNLGIVFPELRVETQIGETSSIKAGVGVFFVGEYTSTNGKTEKNTIESVTRISMEPRFYVSRERRLQMGKSIDYFSGGYVGVPIGLYPGQGYSLGVLYGTQGVGGRSKTFFYNFGIGVGYGDLDLKKNEDIKEINVISEISVGIRLK